MLGEDVALSDVTFTGMPGDRRLTVVARHNRVQPAQSNDPEPCAGVYAEVLAPGRIRVGDLMYPA